MTDTARTLLSLALFALGPGTACGSSPPASDDPGDAAVDPVEGGDGDGDGDGDSEVDASAPEDDGGTQPTEDCYQAHDAFDPAQATRLSDLPPDTYLYAGEQRVFWRQDGGLYALEVGATERVLVAQPWDGGSVHERSDGLYALKGAQLLRLTAGATVFEVVRDDLPQEGVIDFTIGERHLFYEIAGALEAYPLDGSAPFTAVTASQPVARGSLAEHGDYLYFVGFDDSRPYRVRLGSDEPATVLSSGDDTWGDDPGALTTDGEYVYWTTRSTIKHVAVGMPASVAELTTWTGGDGRFEGIYGLKLIRDRLYFTGSGLGPGTQLAWTAIDGSACGAVVTFDFGDGVDAYTWSEGGLWVAHDGALWHQPL
jgi:hypothetical protein